MPNFETKSVHHSTADKIAKWAFWGGIGLSVVFAAMFLNFGGFDAVLDGVMSSRFSIESRLAFPPLIALSASVSSLGGALIIPKIISISQDASKIFKEAMTEMSISQSPHDIQKAQSPSVYIDSVTPQEQMLLESRMLKEVSVVDRVAQSLNLDDSRNR